MSNYCYQAGGTHPDLVVHKYFILHMHGGQGTLCQKSRGASNARIITTTVCTTICGPHISNFEGTRGTTDIVMVRFTLRFCLIFQFLHVVRKGKVMLRSQVMK